MPQKTFHWQPTDASSVSGRHSNSQQTTPWPFISSAEILTEAPPPPSAYNCKLTSWCCSTINASTVFLLLQTPVRNESATAFQLLQGGSQFQQNSKRAVAKCWWKLENQSDFIPSTNASVLVPQTFDYIFSGWTVTAVRRIRTKVIHSIYKHQWAGSTDTYFIFRGELWLLLEELESVWFTPSTAVRRVRIKMIHSIYCC